MTVKGVVETGSNSSRDLGAQPGVDRRPLQNCWLDYASVMDALAIARQDEGCQPDKRSCRKVLWSEMSVETNKAAASLGCQRSPATVESRRLDKQLVGAWGLKTRLMWTALAAEVALSAAKADVREELDRLAAHLDTARCTSG